MNEDLEPKTILLIGAIHNSPISPLSARGMIASRTSSLTAPILDAYENKLAHFSAYPNLTTLGNQVIWQVENSFPISFES